MKEIFIFGGLFLNCSDGEKLFLFAALNEGREAQVGMREQLFMQRQENREARVTLHHMNNACDSTEDLEAHLIRNFY